MADHPSHMRIDKFLGNGRPLPWIAGVIFRLQLPLHWFSADTHALDIEVVDGELRAVLDIGALMRARPRQRRGAANPHHGLGQRGGGRNAGCRHQGGTAPGTALNASAPA